MSKSVKRIVDTDFWNDSLVVDHFTPEDKYFMLYLLTNPHTRQSGIYRLLKRHMVFELGYSKETCDYLLMRFKDNYGLIEYSHETQEIAILNYLKYSIVKGGKPVNDCIRRDLAAIKDLNLINQVNKHLEPFFNTTKKESIKQIKTIFNEYDNKNDNDNERIVNESSPKKKKRFVKPTISEIEEYCKERNNNINAEQFFDFYESKGWYVGKNKMKNWKAAVRTWEQRNQNNNSSSKEEFKPDWIDDVYNQL